ncbi:hypothetical protein SLA2020_517710 [Shorea laevis]
MDDKRLTYTLDEALDAVGFGKFQVLVLSYAGLGWFAEAMEVMILSFIGPAVKSEWNISSTEESLLTSVVFAGLLIGAYSWGLISDNCGRRNGFLGITLVTSGVGFLSTFSPNYLSLVILRFVVGFGLGGGSVFASWFLEFVPASNRGTWMVLFSTFWTFGTIFEASLAWIVMPRLNWRWLLALSSVPSLAQVLLYDLVPESLRYLCVKGNTSDAHKTLEKIAVMNQRKLPPGMLVSHRTSSQDDESAPSELSSLLSPERKTLMRSNSFFSTFFMLFSSKLIQITLLLWVLYFGNVFSYYGIILLTSELSSGQSGCSSTNLSSRNFQDTSVYVETFITSLAELPGLLLSAILVDRIGRKLSMMFMFIMVCVCLLPLLTHQSAILTTGLLFGARMFAIGTFTVANIYCPELYPTNVRATGAGTASAIGRLGGVVSPLVAVGLVTGCHQTTAIIVFVIVMVVSAISSMLFPYETNGRELSDTVDISTSKEAIVEQ